MMDRELLWEWIDWRMDMLGKKPWDLAECMKAKGRASFHKTELSKWSGGHRRIPPDKAAALADCLAEWSRDSVEPTSPKWAEFRAGLLGDADHVALPVLPSFEFLDDRMFAWKLLHRAIHCAPDFIPLDLLISMSDSQLNAASKDLVRRDLNELIMVGLCVQGTGRNKNSYRLRARLACHVKPPLNPEEDRTKVEEALVTAGEGILRGNDAQNARSLTKQMIYVIGLPSLADERKDTLAFKLNLTCGELLDHLPESKNQEPLVQYQQAVQYLSRALRIALELQQGGGNVSLQDVEWAWKKGLLRSHYSLAMAQRHYSDRLSSPRDQTIVLDRVTANLDRATALVDELYDANTLEFAYATIIIQALLAVVFAARAQPEKVAEAIEQAEMQWRVIERVANDESTRDRNAEQEVLQEAMKLRSYLDTVRDICLDR